MLWQGPWVDFAHACAIDGGKVFLAGVYSFGSEASVSNAVGILDLPNTSPPNWLTPTMIAIISVASALHIINFAAVVTFTRRRGYSRVLLWSVAAVFFSGHMFIPCALFSLPKFSRANSFYARSSRLAAPAGCPSTVLHLPRAPWSGRAATQLRPTPEADG
jgi:hypothetical protein